MRTREIAIIAIKDKQVSSANVIELNNIGSALKQLESDGTQRVLFTYLDGKTLNTTLPIDSEQQLVEAIKSEFEAFEAWNN